MTVPLRVLLVEDAEDDAELVLLELREGGFEPVHARVDTPEAMALALEGGCWQAIICDHTMPRFSAPAALRLLQERGLDLPFLIVSGAIGEDVAVAAMKAGAHDYILKDSLARLVPALRRELREAEERSRRRGLEEALRHNQELEAMGRIAAAVAHDFMNYLTAMRGFGELLATEEDEEQRRLYLARLLEVSESAQHLIAQLLAFGRSEPAAPRVVDLNSVIAGAEPVLRRLVSPPTRVELSLADDLPPVRVDPNQLQRVLLNLVTNARDAMPDGGTLRISTRADEREETGRSVALVVEDTGVGMDEEVRARLFEPYFTTKAAGRGTGLGLATVYGIVTQSGGLVDVESRRGEGSVFRVRLPAAS